MRYARLHRRLLTWYTRKGRHFPWRKRHISNDQKIVAEVLRQRTRAETVNAFFGVFACKFPGWKALAAASQADLEHFLVPIGLWRRRATSLRALGKEMAARNGRFPRDREEIERLPGVGQYIASSVLLLVHGKPESLLDVNMARVLERYFGPRKMADIRYDPYLQHLPRAVVAGSQPEHVNWALLDLGALVCRAQNPKCSECPLLAGCKHANAPPKNY